ESAKAQPRRFLSDGLWPVHMHVLEGLAALEHDAGQIDRSLAAGQRMGDLLGIGHVAFDEADLAHLAHGAQEEGAVGTPGGDLDAPALLGQPAHHIAPQETRAAEHRDLSYFHGARIRLRRRYLAGGTAFVCLDFGPCRHSRPHPPWPGLTRPSSPKNPRPEPVEG